jgi:hypothetical protein
VLVGLAALALGGALLLERQRSAAVAPVQAVASARRSTVQEVSPPPLPEPLPPVLEERSAAAATSASSSVRASRRSSGGAETSDLSEQMHLIEAARTAVAAHDSPAALAALGSYSEKFPRGSFGQEAMVLRIRALDQGGEAARASALARSFIAKFPHSPHVARLKPIAERGSSR